MSDIAEQRVAAAGPANDLARRASRQGLLYGLGAYISWGFFPLYFRTVREVNPLLVVCHRICWSALFLGVLVSFRRDWESLWSVVRNRRNLCQLGLAALLIAGNWLAFIYAVASRQLLQSSMGYFINPLVSVALGMFFLRERLRRWQSVAVLVAVGAVFNLALRGSGVPWLALTLAATFGLYGLVRKKVNVDPVHALSIETFFLLPVAIAVIVLPVFPRSAPGTVAILSLSGVLTAVPLIMFGACVRLLKLSTVGLLQYIVPTLQFGIALVLLREPLDRAKLVSFTLCWLAIAIYVTDSFLARVSQPIASEAE